MAFLAPLLSAVGSAAGTAASAVGAGAGALGSALAGAAPAAGAAGTGAGLAGPSAATLAGTGGLAAGPGIAGAALPAGFVGGGAPSALNLVGAGGSGGFLGAPAASGFVGGGSPAIGNIAAPAAGGAAGSSLLGSALQGVGAFGQGMMQGLQGQAATPGMASSLGNFTGGLIGQRTGLTPIAQQIAGMGGQMPANSMQSMISGLMKPPQHTPPGTGEMPPTQQARRPSLLQPMQQGGANFSLLQNANPYTRRFTLL